jgi:LPXTG-motif cell wall-anchored protein
MKMKKICLATVVLTLSMIVLLGVPATAEEAVVQPQLPHAFYGIVEVGSSPAGQGLVVEAVGTGVRSNIAGNPVTTLSDGIYGSANFSFQKLMVQGNIEVGTPLEFYVGGILAEVYDVAKGGPWATSYPYAPGELTELNLRIATQPAVGQTREPTPVQTNSVSSEVTASSTVASGGSLLPQLPESQGQQSSSEGTLQTPVGSGQSGATGQGENPVAGSPESGSQSSTGSSEPLTGSGSMTLLIAAGIVLLLVVAGGTYYYTKQKKSESGKTEEPEKKEE